MLSGDINPIHMSDILAVLFGQKGRIAHGFMVLGKAFSTLKVDTLDHVAFYLKGPTPHSTEVSLMASLGT